MCGRSRFSRLVMALLLAALSFSWLAGAPPALAIVGGVESTPNAWPWMVRILRGGQTICGGSLIRANVVLTAAHCLSRYDAVNRREVLDDISAVEVVAGDHRASIVEPSEQRRVIAQATLHPQFNSLRRGDGSIYGVENDIALLRLSASVSLGPAVDTLRWIATGEESLWAAGAQALALGWGYTAPDGPVSDVLRQLPATIVQNTRETCNDSTICIGLPGQTTCHGDSGGPLAVRDRRGRWALAGVMSVLIAPRCTRHAGYEPVARYTRWLKAELHTAALAHDFDGDLRQEPAVWQPARGDWFARQSDGSLWWSVLGWDGVLPVPGDYDGDGRSDPAIWGLDYAGEAFWYVFINGGDETLEYSLGEQGSIPVPGDYDGDGRSDPAVYSSITGWWEVINSTDGSWWGFPFGIAGAIPLSGDYDQDGIDDLMLWSPADQTWYFFTVGDQQMGMYRWGAPGDVPLSGDYDGNGADDLALYRPADGSWHVTANIFAVSWEWDKGADDVWYVVDGALPSSSLQSGWINKIAVPGDYDGDGRSDIAAWDAASQSWRALNLAGQPLPGYPQTFGAASDLPLSAAYPRWSGGAASYAAGTQVSYQGKIYRALQGHTSQPGWNPLDAASLWQLAYAPSSSAPPPASGHPIWSGSAVSYAAGALVSYQGQTYRCLQAHTSQPDWTPAAAHSLWQLQ